MLLCCFFNASLTCMVRYLGENISPYTILFYRNFFSLLIIAPFALSDIRSNKDSDLYKFSKLNLARGVGGFLSMIFWFLGVVYLPITEAVALSFTLPLFVTIFAMIFLKERITYDKWLALLIGSIGVYLILLPGTTGFNKLSILVLVSTILWASTNIMVKSLTSSQSPQVIIFYMALTIFPLSIPFFIKNFHIPNLKEFVILILIACSSNIAQLFLAKAYKVTKVSVVIPFDFTRLIFASIFSFLLFSEIIKMHTIIGAALIIFGSFIVVRKESK